MAAEIAHKEPRIDVLINNAGAMFSSRRFTEDGLEYTFALNHMAYFVVTEGLRERLLASSPARIVNSASAAHQGATLDFGDLQSAKGFGAMKAYSRSKLCNVLFTRELARRLHGTGVTANCLHPGFVATRFGDQSGGGDLPRKGRGNDHLSGHFGHRYGNHGRIFLQVPPDNAVARGAGRRAALLLWERSAALAGLKV